MHFDAIDPRLVQGAHRAARFRLIRDRELMKGELAAVENRAGANDARAHQHADSR
jgi:hypothetical protein